MNEFLPAIERLRGNTLRLRKTTCEERILKLRKLEAAVQAHLPQFYEAMQKDFHKPQAEVDLTEIFPIFSEIKHFSHHLDQWMNPQWVATPITLMGSRSEVRYEPKGLVLIIGPWNYPINLTLAPIIAAVAAGNTIVLKPSEMTPNTSAVIKSVLSQAFSPDELVVVEGDAKDTQELLKVPFDHIFFTGSTKVGRIVMEAAAKHLASVTLELGGKSPVIIDSEVDLKQAAQAIAWGKFINGGQTCVAPDYVFLPSSLMDPFVGEVRKVLNGFYGEESRWKDCPDFCHIINDRNFARLTGLLDASIAQGAKVALGGSRDAGSRFLSPTLLTQVSPQMPIMSEEIFGPILPILTYEDLDKEVLAYIRAQPKPLALYVFSSSTAKVEKILEETTSGGTCVNATVIHLANPDLPFGGVGHSGMGSYHGISGFKVFSHERSVLKQSKIGLLPLFFPPYTERVKKLIKLAMRFFA